MVALRLTTMQTTLQKIVSFGVLLFILADVAACRKAPPPPPPPPSKPATRPPSKPAGKRKPADTKTQQQYYDRGLQAYSKENFEAAKDAFQHVIDLGPSTALGLQAQENLTKVRKILKTLEEIGSK